MRAIAVLAAALSLAACASPGKRVEAPPSYVEPYDPFEGANRRALAANRVVDDLYIEPMADLYRFIFPARVRQSAANVTETILTPSYILNDLLQADLDDAGHNTVRLLANTTLGVGGLFDVAEGWGYEDRPEDLGQTLGNWGVPSGPYVVAPVVGPTTARGILGSLAKLGLSPTTQLILPDKLAVRGAMVGQRTAERRVSSHKQLTDIYESPEGYIELRSLFLQQQVNELYEDGDPYENLPDF
jgi:phospholipid-binding lipoprotein MlaA